MKHLLIDIGSTSIKSAVCGRNGMRMAERIPFPEPALDDGIFYEVETEKILRIVRKLVDGSDCDDVYISTQMHGYFLADAWSRLLTRYISWQDRRAGKAGIRLGVSAESGTSMKANLPRAGVEAIARSDPDLYSRAAEFFTLGSYIAFDLTGNNITHITDAAASGFYNVRTCTRETTRLRLPEASYEVRPAGIRNGKTIYTPCGDQQCAVSGAGGTEESLVLNLGTAAQLCTIENGFVSGNFESRPYFGGKTLCTVTGLSGGKRLRGLSAEADERVEQELADEYAAAVKRLPKRKKLIVTGGALRFYGKLIGRVVDRLGFLREFNEGADALTGLKKLTEGKE